jgi:hypothetical protein
MPTLESRPRHQDQILTQRASDSQILLNLAGGEYYALDEVGSRVWELCDGTRTVGEVVVIVSGEYDAPADTIQADVLELLEDLLNEKLVIMDG